MAEKRQLRRATGCRAASSGQSKGFRALGPRGLWQRQQAAVDGAARLEQSIQENYEHSRGGQLALTPRAPERAKSRASAPPAPLLSACLGQSSLERPWKQEAKGQTFQEKAGERPTALVELGGLGERPCPQAARGRQQLQARRGAPRRTMAPWQGASKISSLERRALGKLQVARGAGRRRRRESARALRRWPRGLGQETLMLGDFPRERLL